MDAIFCRHLDGGFCCLEVAADPVVERLREALEVDVDGIDVRQQVQPRVLLDLAVRHEHGGKADFFEEPCRVVDEFIADERLVVGEGHADVARRLLEPLSCRHDFLRRHAVQRQSLPRKAIEAGLRDRVVLAERAAQVAAEAAEREDVASRMEVVERLLLDGVERRRSQEAVVQGADDAALILPRAAEARLPVGEMAAVRAEPADGFGSRLLRHGASPRSARA